MLGIVLATHGKLGSGMKDAAEVIMGNTENIVTVSLNPGDDVDKLGCKISNAILEVNQGDGVVVLVDLISASPYNQAVIAVNNLDPELKDSVYIIGGVNLPMLLEIINHQILKTKVEEIEKSAVSQAQNCINSWHVPVNADTDDEDEDDDF